MGLSDEERYEGIAIAIERLNSIVSDWDHDSRESAKSFNSQAEKRLRQLVRDLWQGFFGSVNNSLHWIMGSSSSNEITTDSPRTPWELAIQEHLSKHLQRHDPWADYSDPANDNYDPMTGLSLESLLGNEWMWASYVFRIYQWTEQLIYYLRRYEDDFLKEYSDLSSLVSQILGECFTFFRHDDIFPKAYVVHQIGENLFGVGYQVRNDALVTLAKENYLTHIHALMKLPLDKVCSIHVELEKARILAMKRAELAGDEHEWYGDPELIRIRLLTLAKVSGHKITGHAVKKLMDSVKEHFPDLAAAFEAEVKEVTKVEEKDHEPFYLQRLNAYGFRAYSLVHDLLDEHFPKDKPDKPEEPEAEEPKEPAEKPKPKVKSKTKKGKK